MGPAIFLLAFQAASAPTIVDRVAVVVGNTVITETEVIQEARLEAFLNQARLDLGPASRRAAAERLVDQYMVRNEMRVGAYAQPSDADVESTLRQFRQEHFASPAQFQASLQKYGVAEDEVKRYLRWQIAALRFTDLRFGGAAAGLQEANRAAPGDVDQQLDGFLKDARANTKIRFKPEAFQ